MTTPTTYPLRLPKSIKAAAEELSKADGTSLNQFVATAVAEKIAVLKTAAFFEERANRARAAPPRKRVTAKPAVATRRAATKLTLSDGQSVGRRDGAGPTSQS